MNWYGRDPDWEDAKGFRIVRTEEAVFAAHPRATHYRYPYVYGPHQLVPREWCIVKRILDRRPHIVLPDDGLTLHHCGYAENVAHAVLPIAQQRLAAQLLHVLVEEHALDVTGADDLSGA